MLTPISTTKDTQFSPISSLTNASTIFWFQLLQMWLCMHVWYWSPTPLQYLSKRINTKLRPLWNASCAGAMGHTRFRYCSNNFSDEPLPISTDLTGAYAATFLHIPLFFHLPDPPTLRATTITTPTTPVTMATTTTMNFDQAAGQHNNLQRLYQYHTWILSCWQSQQNMCNCCRACFYLCKKDMR